MVVDTETDVIVLGVALAKVVSKKLAVPEDCVHLVWGSLYYNADTASTDVEVTLVLQPLTEEIWDRLDVETNQRGIGIAACFGSVSFGASICWHVYLPFMF